MPTYDIEIGKSVFNDAYYPYLDDETRLQILFGGSSSGKSVFVAQRIIRDILKGGRNYLCTRKIQRDIRQSQFMEMRRAIDRFGVAELFTVNKSDLTITCANGYQAICKGLDDPEKIKSIVPAKGVITDVWIEEATQITPDDFKQLGKRLRGLTAGIKKRVTLTFNPILRSHWIYKTWFQGRFGDHDRDFHSDELLILKTTYRDNRFLEPDDIRGLETETDEYYHRVYTLGEWGVLGGVIFNNWHVEDIKSGPLLRTFDIYRNGLDFGFAFDTTHLCRSYYHRASRTIYITDEYRDTELTNDQIAANIKPIVGSELVVCDSSEPKSIVELCNHGINAVGARKGPDSVNFGIQWLQQQTIIIDQSCVNTIQEFESYHWEIDRNGEVKIINGRPKAVDRNNHAVDSVRYSYEDEMLLDADGEIEGLGETLGSMAEW